MEIALWIATGVLAAAYLATGLTKALAPKERLRKNLPWVEDYSATTVRLIGAVEVVGAVGLVLPWLTGIAPVLTPLAALGLVMVQVLAIPVHVRRRETKTLPVNIVLLALACVVAVGRSIQLITT